MKHCIVHMMDRSGDEIMDVCGFRTSGLRFLAYES